MQRKEFLRRRDRVVHKKQKEKAIAQKLLPFLKPGLKIAAYIPIRSEVDVFDDICRHLLADDKIPSCQDLPHQDKTNQDPLHQDQINQDPPHQNETSQEKDRQQKQSVLLVPKVISKTDMIFLPCRNLQPGVWGILEPDGSKEEEQIPDLLVIPMAGFDQLHRMGYGGGYYDRYLAAHPALKIGIAFDEQEGKINPSPWDVDMDVIITPTRILCKESLNHLVDQKHETAIDEHLDDQTTAAAGSFKFSEASAVEHSGSVKIIKSLKDADSKEGTAMQSADADVSSREDLG